MSDKSEQMIENEDISYMNNLEETHLNEHSGKYLINKKDMWKEHKSIVIDRNQEDKDIETFQKTGDMQLLEKLYKNRIPTLKIWVAKHYYPGLTISPEDFLAELSIVFIKAAQKFQKSRGNFNTCLFNYLDNRIKNLKSGTHAKKRVSENYKGPRSGMVLSLDFPCNDKDGSDVTLGDVIPDPEFDGEKIPMDDTIDALSDGDTIVKEFLKKVSHGESIANLLKEAKQKKCSFVLNNKSVKKFKSGGKKAIKDFIKNNNLFDQDFELMEYQINDLQLSFKVQLKKTKEFEIISKAMRNFKKNKKQYISKIKP